MPRSWRLLVAALVAPVLLVGCSGGSKVPANAAPDLLAKAKQTIDATPSAHFDLTSGNVPPGRTSLIGGKGDVSRPAKFKGDLEVTFGSSSATVSVVSVGGKVYAKLPFAASYVPADPSQFGFGDPGRLMDPNAGLSTMLTKATDPQLGRKQRIGGEVVQEINATVPGQVVKDLLTSADPAKPVKATFAVVESTNQLRRVVVTGPFFQADTDSTFTMLLDRYGEKVDIRAPDGAGG
jgi:lipoprotein LprG